MSTWIVTGASRGLGRHLTLQLAQRGDTVLACARDEARLATLASIATGGEVRPVPLDLSDPAPDRRAAARCDGRRGRHRRRHQ